MYQAYYGINTDSNMKYKDGVNIIFMDEFYLKEQSEKEEYLTYCEDNELDPEDPESKNEFVDNYENESMGWWGLEGLITDYINNHDCDHHLFFMHDDYILGFKPRIPENEEEKAQLPTQEQIREILAKYFNPLLEEPAIIDWYDIYE